MDRCQQPSFFFSVQIIQGQKPIVPQELAMSRFQAAQETNQTLRSLQNNISSAQ
jgi:hypothetical protein